MKNIKNILLALAFGSTLTLGSCSDFMDLTPNNEYDETDVFGSAALTQAWVNRV